MDDSYPRPVSDPAAGGIPEYADDDSTAKDDVDSPPEADGPDPYPLPLDRDDGAQAIKEYGTTPERTPRVATALGGRSRPARPTATRRTTRSPSSRHCARRCPCTTGPSRA